jgi:hypothetical protein
VNLQGQRVVRGQWWRSRREEPTKPVMTHACHVRGPFASAAVVPRAACRASDGGTSGAVSLVASLPVSAEEPSAESADSVSVAASAAALSAESVVSSSADASSVALSVTAPPEPSLSEPLASVPGPVAPSVPPSARAPSRSSAGASFSPAGTSPPWQLARVGWRLTRTSYAGARRQRSVVLDGPPPLARAFSTWIRAQPIRHFDKPTVTAPRGR